MFSTQPLFAFEEQHDPRAVFCLKQIKN